MTPQEFKAWFEGFTEAFDRIPTKTQWTRVKERVAEIDGKPVTERVFVDRYWPNINQYPYYPRQYWSANSCIGGSATFTQVQANLGHNAAAQSFNSSQAMFELGRADAKSVA